MRKVWSEEQRDLVGDRVGGRERERHQPRHGRERFLGGAPEKPKAVTGLPNPKRRQWALSWAPLGWHRVKHGEGERSRGGDQLWQAGQRQRQMNE